MGLWRGAKGNQVRNQVQSQRICRVNGKRLAEMPNADELRDLMAQARAAGLSLRGPVWGIAQALLDADLWERGLLVEQDDPATGKRRTWQRKAPPNRKGQMVGYPVRCCAKTRRGTFCQCLPVEGKRRCRFHGGLSTGPKTAEGKARQAAAVAESNRRRAAERRQQGGRRG
jgi:hypothetical protein